MAGASPHPPPPSHWDRDNNNSPKPYRHSPDPLHNTDREVSTHSPRSRHRTSSPDTNCEDPSPGHSRHSPPIRDRLGSPHNPESGGVRQSSFRPRSPLQGRCGSPRRSPPEIQSPRAARAEPIGHRDRLARYGDSKQDICPPNVTVLQPSVNHPMFPFWCSSAASLYWNSIYSAAMSPFQAGGPAAPGAAPHPGLPVSSAAGLMLPGLGGQELRRPPIPPELLVNCQPMWLSNRGDTSPAGELPAPALHEQAQERGLAEVHARGPCPADGQRKDLGETTAGMLASWRRLGRSDVSPGSRFAPYSIPLSRSSYYPSHLDHKPITVSTQRGHTPDSEHRPPHSPSRPSHHSPGASGSLREHSSHLVRDRLLQTHPRTRTSPAGLLNIERMVDGLDSTRKMAPH